MTPHLIPVRLDRGALDGMFIDLDRQAICLIFHGQVVQLSPIDANDRFAVRGFIDRQIEKVTKRKGAAA